MFSSHSQSEDGGPGPGGGEGGGLGPMDSHWDSLVMERRTEAYLERVRYGIKLVIIMLVVLVSYAFGGDHILWHSLFHTVFTRSKSWPVWLQTPPGTAETHLWFHQDRRPTRALQT